jgi:prevent-host-death family protein
VRYVSATEAKQSLAAVLDAAQREPVVIRRQQRDVAVVLSVQEYARLTRSPMAPRKRGSRSSARPPTCR